MTLLVAGSPVEIIVDAEDAHFAAEKQMAASTMFHDLTSRLELDLLTANAEGGEPWPRHRFWFGDTGGGSAAPGAVARPAGRGRSPPPRRLSST